MNELMNKRLAYLVRSSIGKQVDRMSVRIWQSDPKGSQSVGAAPDVDIYVTKRSMTTS